MCGEQLWASRMKRLTRGSPPRVRGTGSGYAGRDRRRGITPACAGNRFHLFSPCSTVEDHPRVCGEQVNVRISRQRGIGSPPRVRGTVSGDQSTGCQSRITPACAGNRLCRAFNMLCFQDHPRVCGEQRLTPLFLWGGLGSPPRVRGTGACPRRRK